MRGKSQGWWYSVLRRKKYLSYLDVKTLADNIGNDTLEFLLSKVKKEEQKIKKAGSIYFFEPAHCE